MQASPTSHRVVAHALRARWPDAKTLGSRTNCVLLWRALRPDQPYLFAVARRQQSGYRNVTFRTGGNSHRGQGLIEGGADLILIETIFDTLNAKAAIFAVQGVFEELGFELPIMISGNSSPTPLRPHAVGPDHRSVLELCEPCQADFGGLELRTGRQRTAPVPRRVVEQGRHSTSRPAPTRVC